MILEISVVTHEGFYRVDRANEQSECRAAQWAADFALYKGGGKTRVGFRHSESWLSYGDVVSVEAVFAAWTKFCRGKRARFDVQLFERNLETNLFDLQDDLANRSYEHGGYIPFQICDPKQRQIHKATVRDRVVHQLIVSSVEPLFERRFIYDSFSCRKGKGTHAAIDRLRVQLRRASNNNTRTVYALKCDIKKFFASVDHAILRDLLRRQIADPDILALLGRVIDSHTAIPGKGMPLGNLTSQLFANVYLHELDWFVKHTLRRSHYVRYCDDFVILGNDRERLQRMVPRIAEFLCDYLRLSLHPNKVVTRSWSQGIDFLGYVLKPYSTVLRSKAKQRMLAKADLVNLSSYLGLCSHANAHELSQIVQILARTRE